MTRLVIDGSTTSRRKASTASFSVGFRPSVATQTCSCFNLPSLLRRRKGLFSRLCGNYGRYANPSEKMRNQGLPSQKPGANRPPHPLEPTGFQPPERAQLGGRAQPCQGWRTGFESLRPLKFYLSNKPLRSEERRVGK